MTTKVKMCVTLEPKGKPWIIAEANGQGQLQQLVTTTDFSFDFRADDSGYLKITHFDKTDHDHDTAVIVKEIRFFDIADPKFVWAGTYYPDYPEHYTDKNPALPIGVFSSGVYLDTSNSRPGLDLRMNFPAFTCPATQHQ
jgi:hypothetical protein